MLNKLDIFQDFPKNNKHNRYSLELLYTIMYGLKNYVANPFDPGHSSEITGRIVTDSHWGLNSSGEVITCGV